MRFVIDNSEAKILVFEAQYAAVIDSLRARLPGVGAYICIGQKDDASVVPSWAESFDAVMASGDPAGPSDRAREDDIAYLIYTSGTTGRPKGCALGHRDQAALGRAIASQFDSGPGDRALLMMPWFHIGAKGVQNGIHARGGMVVVQRGFDPAAVLEAIERERITITHMAPTMVQLLLEEPSLPRRNRSSLRQLLYSAAAMPTPVLRQGLELLGNIFIQMYGQTEGPVTVLGVNDHRPDGTERERARLASIGRAVEGVEIRIVDDDGNDCAPGTPGEIVHRSPMVCRGYWKNEDATRELLRGGWCHTGDIGRVDEDGFYYLVDRKKDMIVSGGENVYSREVEEALLKNPAISQAAVIGVPDAKWGEAVRAIVVLKAGARATEAAVIDDCRRWIASYKKPRDVIFVADLPKLVNGKVDKLELRRSYSAG
jgi:acyl-CoA synthetase (AMP-forming)/AMP-acid ligase II